MVLHETMARLFPGAAGVFPRVRGCLRGWLRGSATAVALLVVGCGHPATREECDEIFERTAAIELESQNVRDPALVKQRIEDARRDKGDELLRQCMGRRITDGAMSCVRQAKTVKELDACLM